ncbi:hypothetical protein SacmaDRAFT_0886 [Saccharomonospora marina XMU15]|uniref:YbaB/EbfC DNA-binding family protein n=1 Tax=Saccharomonospora marina XMU15 TaxID=882083 RepID=H5X977_9PSEU|nr:YbaB/EbfC family nucleoid-associated protein [Saccharomonospora marina]EHR49179.1 hypothetical protein SacmaDRAFT_0886 [Saccharomonospora marina XMU15]
MTEYRAQVDELLADYHRSREQLSTVQRDLAAVTASVSSDDGLVTAVVGARGALTDLLIADDAYDRYRPAELAAQIVRLAGEATVRAFSRAADVLAPALPSGTDPQALLLGTADLTEDDIAEDGPQEEDEASFEDQNWLDDGEWSGSR